MKKISIRKTMLMSGIVGSGRLRGIDLRARRLQSLERLDQPRLRKPLAIEPDRLGVRHPVLKSAVVAPTTLIAWIPHQMAKRIGALPGCSPSGARASNARSPPRRNR
jgi:hypothetical protein